MKDSLRITQCTFIYRSSPHLLGATTGHLHYHTILAPETSSSNRSSCSNKRSFLSKTNASCSAGLTFLLKIKKSRENKRQSDQFNLAWWVWCARSKAEGRLFLGAYRQPDLRRSIKATRAFMSISQHRSDKENLLLFFMSLRFLYRLRNPQTGALSTSYTVYWLAPRFIFYPVSLRSLHILLHVPSFFPHLCSPSLPPDCILFFCMFFCSSSGGTYFSVPFSYIPAITSSACHHCGTALL